MSACPKCGFEAVEGVECPRCGIVIERYAKAQAPLLNSDGTRVVVHYAMPPRKAGAGMVLLLLALVAGIAGGIAWWRASLTPTREPSATRAPTLGQGTYRDPLPSRAPDSVAGAPAAPASPQAEPPRAEMGQDASGPPREADAPQDSPPTYVSSSWFEGADGFERALKEQRLYGAPMVIYFHTSWCPHCKRLERDILSDPSVARYLDGFIKVRINPEDGAAEKSLESSHGVTGYPSFFIMGNRGGLTLVRPPREKPGANAAEAFLERCRSAAEYYSPRDRHDPFREPPKRTALMPQYPRRWTMKKGLTAFLGIAVAITAMGLFAKGSPVKVKELSSDAQVAVKGSFSLVADGAVARLRGHMKYIPLRVYLGIQGKGKIFAERSSFTLTDPKGARQTMATVQEIAADYGSNYESMDYEYYKEAGAPDYGSHFNGCDRLLKVAFFPNPSGPNVLFDQVELPGFSYFSALMYFPNPAGPAEGTYSLNWTDPKTGNSLDVPFTIKWEKEKTKKGA